MKKTKFQRFAAALLALTMLFGAGLTTVGAADAETTVEESTGGKDLEQIRELLNADSYSEYMLSDAFTSIEMATDTVEIDVIGDIDTTQDGNCYIDEETAATKSSDLNDYAHKTTLYADKDGKEVISLYTPSNGSVSWKINLPKSAKYAIVIEYYPVEGKATAIERVFKINNKVPFSEARYLTLHKNWVTSSVKYTLRDGETVDSAKADLEKIGVTVTVHEDDKGNRSLYCSLPEVWDQTLVEKCNERGLRFMTTDITNNEIRTEAVQSPVWTTYYLRDSSGYYTDNFVFALDAGENVLTLEGKNEPMAIRSIKLIPAEETPDYDTYVKNLGNVKDNANDTVRIEAEYTGATSSKTIYALEDRSDANNSPTDVTRTVLNTMGGEKWQTAGQYVEYSFRVSGSGWYDVVSRFRQNILDGMYVCRSLYIYSSGIAEGAAGYYDGAPFEEAKSLRYNYSSNWNVTKLTDGAVDADGNERSYPVYFVGTDDNPDAYYTIRFEVTLGSMGDIVREVKEVLDSINADYLNILRLTGTNPNANNSYGFSRVMPDTLIDMIVQSRKLDNSANKDNKNYTPGIAERLTELAGQKSSNVGVLQRVAAILIEMGTDEEEIPSNLDNLKTYIGNLGTFLSDAQTQPLLLDFIQIQPASSQEMPSGKAGFFKAMLHEIKGFFMSFVRDYNSMGAMEEDADRSIEVWLAYGRDQSQVIRNLINNDFTPEKGIAVDLKLVAAATLLPSILSGSGPDVYLGLGQADVINYAIRSALINIDDQPDFDEVKENFNESAMLVLGVEDADQIMHYYGLPETQSFSMMFVRDDILAELNLEVPKTWDDLLAAIPVLQSRKMEIGLTTDFQIFMYQRGGELFADDGMRINLDSVVGLSSFEYMCNLFTQYSFPYTYNAANRFRTGEMPIIIGDYTGMYNQLKVFATEIEGVWEFLPVPGTEQEDGSVNNVSISSVAAVVMVSGVGDCKDDAWEYMKWYTGKDCQSDYTNEMVAILGPSAKHPTANKYALESLPWTTEELAQVQAQFDNLAAVPNYPGAYIVGRYTNFAFLSAYNDKADPSDAIFAYVSTINKEITRKRNEFKLETLDVGQTLAQKRLEQVGGKQNSEGETEKLGLLDRIEQHTDYKDAVYADAIKEARAAITDQNVNGLTLAAEKIRTILRGLDENYRYVESYSEDGNQNYKNSSFWKDLEDIMGYDMNDKALTNAQKKQARKCYYYEVYEKATEMVTLLHFTAEYLEDAANALSSY